MSNIKRYQNPLDELAECDNGDYVLYSDYEILKSKMKKYIVPVVAFLILAPVSLVVTALVILVGGWYA